MASGFPFIKLISAENMVGFSEAQKITYLNKVFTDSYKSPLSVIVVDGIERILGRFQFSSFVTMIVGEKVESRKLIVFVCVQIGYL